MRVERRHREVRIESSAWMRGVYEEALERYNAEAAHPMTATLWGMDRLAIVLVPSAGRKLERDVEDDAVAAFCGVLTKVLKEHLGRIDVDGSQAAT